MWNDERALNWAANVLYLLALCIAVYLGGKALAYSSAFPLRVIQVQGDLIHVERSQIVDALQGRISGTFFTVELDSIRSLFESIRWVRHAEVRRVWPDRLEVTLEEHRALAHWGSPGEAKLVSVRGEVFAGESDAELPLLAGPKDSEREVVRRYGEFREALAPLSLTPVRLQLSARRAWQLRLSSGLTLQLGRDGEKETVRDRLERFVAAYPIALAPLSRRLDYVDLRYPGGFALRVPEVAGNEVQKSRRRPKA